MLAHKQKIQQAIKSVHSRKEQYRINSRSAPQAPKLVGMMRHVIQHVIVDVTRVRHHTAPQTGVALDAVGKAPPVRCVRL